MLRCYCNDACSSEAAQCLNVAQACSSSQVKVFRSCLHSAHVLYALPDKCLISVP